MTPLERCKRAMKTNKCKRTCDHKHEFSCLHCIISERISDKIVKWGEENIPNECLYTPPGDATYGRETDVHCTVFFGIHTELAAPVLYLLENEPPFLIRLGQVSCFSNDKFDVVKIDVHSDDLIRLHTKIGECLQSTEPWDCYKPHITIAYVNKGEGQKFAGDATFDRLAVRIDSLCFSSKNGGKCRIRLLQNKNISVFPELMPAIAG